MNRYVKVVGINSPYSVEEVNGFIRDGEPSKLDFPIGTS